MFDTIITKCVKPDYVSWETPTTMLLGFNDQNPKSYSLLKGAEDFIHKQIDIKVSTSKEIYKKAPEIWKQLKESKLKELAQNVDTKQQFELVSDNVYYLINEYNQVVDIIKFYNEDHTSQFMEDLEKYNLELTTTNKTKKMFTDGKGGLIKLVCYDKDLDVTDEKYIPVVMLELNNEKSKYKIYTGIFIYDTFTFVPSISCDYEDDSLSHFISCFNIQNNLDYAKEKSESYYEHYCKFVDNSVEISVREVTNILKSVGYKLQLDDTDKLSPIQNISDEENNLIIQNFYNTFKNITGETTLDILQLSELKKTFRYNKLTLLDVLSILSKEYLQYEGSKVTADILGNIVYKLFNTKNIDKVQVESLKEEVK